MSDKEQKPVGHPQNNPLTKLKGSVQHYDQQFDSVCTEDWEAAMLDGLTSDNAHADALVTPTLKELGEYPDRKR
jgi:hypothetical protein